MRTAMPKNGLALTAITNACNSASRRDHRPLQNRKSRTTSLEQQPDYRTGKTGSDGLTPRNRQNWISRTLYPVAPLNSSYGSSL